jgi:D-alanyl-lipoteichoic acid acyltransferase DltB (MBOAT superfamily)
MLFNSITFLVFFMPASLLVYFLLGRFQMNAAKFWLAALSFLFYGWWNPNYLLLLVGSILFNYGCGYLIQVFQERPKTSSWILAAGITANLGVLVYYKYLLTLFHWFHDHGLYPNCSWGAAILPLGISFFTFTQIGFLIDTQGGNAHERGFLEYVLFVTFFPHLIAGPILHHREIMPQFAKKETYSLRWDNLAIGVSIFIIGLGKKVLIADQLAPIANDVFKMTADKHVLEAWTGVLAYSLQLYFDFAGYSEMALGLARMFNVTFPANFDSPYKSKSIIDFWQRWHISLTRYFTLYLYNPVSLWVIRRRAAKGLPLLKAGDTTWEGFLTMLAAPTLYTMILVGIWHGAGIQFFVFGLLHGFYLCVNHAWRFFGPKFPKTNLPPWVQWIDGAWKWALTYLSVLVALTFFKAKTAGDAWWLILSMFGQGTGDSPGGSTGLVESILDYFGLALPYWGYSDSLLTVGMLLVFILVLPNTLQIFEEQAVSLTKVRSAPALFRFQWRPNILWGGLLAILALVDLLMVTGNSEFLYFRF